MHDKTRGALLTVFMHDRAVILGKRERLSKVLVTLVTGGVGVLLVVIIGVSIAWLSLSFYETIIMMSLYAVYYFAAWIFPWFEYGDGLSERKAKRLRYWMCSFAGQAFLLELYTFVNVQCISYDYRSRYSHRCYSTVWWVVVAGLVALPVIILVLASTLVVYVNIDDEVPVVNFPMFDRTRGSANLGWWKPMRNGPRAILRAWRRNERGRNRGRVEGRNRPTAEERNHETMGDRNNETEGDRSSESFEVVSIGEEMRVIAGGSSRQIVAVNNRERTNQNDAVRERREIEEVESDNSWLSWGRAQYNSAVEGSAAVTRNWLPILAPNREYDGRIGRATGEAERATEGIDRATGGIERATGGILGLLRTPEIREGQNEENYPEEGDERLTEEDSLVDHRHVVNLIVNFPDEVDDILEDSFMDNNTDSPDEEGPPSYGDVERDDLPSYSQLGTKRLQIGNKIIVMDKKLNINTFDQV